MNDPSLLRTSAALSIILSIATYYVREVILGTFVWFFVAPSILAGATSLYQMIHLHVHATLHSGMKTIALWLFLECCHWTISGALLLWLILEVLGKIRGAGADYPTFVVVLCIPQMLMALVEYRTLSTILDVIPSSYNSWANARFLASPRPCPSSFVVHPTLSGDPCGAAMSACSWHLRPSLSSSTSFKRSTSISALACTPGKA
jgi:hypothetical protein